MIRTITGKEFKRMREACGFSAREVAEFLKHQGARITSPRSIYRLESLQEVPARYVTALQMLVGSEAFHRSLAATRANLDPRMRQPRSDDIYPTREVTEPHGDVSQDRTGRAPRHDTEERSVEDFIDFLNALPTEEGAIAWIISFREALRQLLGDVDHIVVNVNLGCDLRHPAEYRFGMIATEHVSSDGAGNTVLVIPSHAEASPSIRLLDDFRRQGYPLEKYHAPHSFDYFFGGQAYLGSIFLFRDRLRPVISERTLETMERLESFFIFALSDLVARQHHHRPFDHAFNEALAFMARDAGLSEQEKRVVILQLFGHTYEQIADRLCVSVDSVRKYVQGIYRKTRTRSYMELFAKYFTPRLGF